MQFLVDIVFSAGADQWKNVNPGDEACSNCLNTSKAKGEKSTKVLYQLSYHIMFVI
jgi:hypothetical protein